MPALERKRAQRKAEGLAGVTISDRSVPASDTTSEQRDRKNTERSQRGGEKNKRLPTNKRERYFK